MADLAGLIVILGSPNDDRGVISEMGQGRLRLGFQKFSELRSENWKVLLTGGFGEHFNCTKLPHAQHGKQFLVSLGLAEPDFVEFGLSRNTVDDALQSRPIVEKYRVPTLIVVSSDFHLERVEFIFRSVFPDRELIFLGAPYLDSRPTEEQDRLLLHESKELQNLREHGESIVGGALNLNSWRLS